MEGAECTPLILPNRTGGRTKLYSTAQKNMSSGEQIQMNSKFLSFTTKEIKGKLCSSALAMGI